MEMPLFIYARFFQGHNQGLKQGLCLLPIACQNSLDISSDIWKFLRCLKMYIFSTACLANSNDFLRRPGYEKRVRISNIYISTRKSEGSWAHRRLGPVIY